MPASKHSLEQVHTLYTLQLDLWKILDAELKHPEEVKQASRQVKTFRTLLSQVDWRYMGGQDIVDDLNQMYIEAQSKLKVANSRGSLKKKKTRR